MMSQSDVQGNPGAEDWVGERTESCGGIEAPQQRAPRVELYLIPGIGSRPPEAEIGLRRIECEGHGEAGSALGADGERVPRAAGPSKDIREMNVQSRTVRGSELTDRSRQGRGVARGNPVERLGRRVLRLA
jgi:hypothetical protein